MLRNTNNSARLYKQMGVAFFALTTFFLVFISLNGGGAGAGGLSNGAGMHSGGGGSGGAGGFLGYYNYGGGGDGNTPPMRASSPYEIAMAKSDPGFESDTFLMKALVSDPRAQRAMTHPAFSISSAVKALTDVSLNREVQRLQEEVTQSGHGPVNAISFFPHSIGKLRTFLERSSSSLRARFNALFEVEAKAAVMKVPSAFAPKAKAMFSLLPGGLAGLENQTIVTMYNKYTDEYSLFNEVRRYRPGYQEKLKPEQEAAVNASYNANVGPDTCDFCSVERTAEDIFGRIESKHCYVASNVAKYESWHSLIVSRHHNPLTFSAEILQDYFKTTQRWFEKVNSIDKDAVYPFMSWDAGPRASASQIHQHLQVVITHDRYLSKTENTRRAASAFERRYVGKNYWAEIATVHSQMGLALSHGNSVIMSHVCPVKEREIIVVTSDHTSKDFAEALNAALEALRDDAGVRALSMGVSFRPVVGSGGGGSLPHPRGASPVEGVAGSEVRAGEREAEQEKNRLPAVFYQGGVGVGGGGGDANHNAAVDEVLDRKMVRGYPTIARIIDRGTPNDLRSDTGAMEYFGANNVGADPYFIMPHLRRRLARLRLSASGAGGGGANDANK